MKRRILPTAALVALVAVLLVGTLSQVDVVRSGLAAAVGSVVSDNDLDAYCPDIHSAIRFGSRDDYKDTQVAELQKFLAYHYGLTESEIVTGYFGPLTYSRLVQFQKENNLPGLGIIDVDTQRAIATACGAASLATTTRDTASASAPTCTLKTESGSYTLGKYITFYWTSERATSARLKETTSASDRLPLPDSERPVEGREYVKATVLGDRLISLEVTGEGGEGTCSTIVQVVKS